MHASRIVIFFIVIKCGGDFTKCLADSFGWKASKFDLFDSKFPSEPIAHSKIRRMCNLFGCIR